MGIKTVMITGDNPLTAAAIAAEAGVDDFLAQATPETKLALIREHQKGGRLVAMTGDGTNDAPALAQADVAVAMNTGTQAAKEAGNMVDLDSNPTKLIEVVEIGKQLLMTRGALTTFSIANDVAKYFAIIPAAFATTYPALERAQRHAPGDPAERHPERRHLQRAHHHRRSSRSRLRGIKYRAVGASLLLRDHLLVYGLGGIVVPVRRHQAHRPAPRRPAPRLNRSLAHARPASRSAVVSLLVLTLVTGVAYPLLVTGIAQAAFPTQANGSLIVAGREGRRVAPHRPVVRRPEVLLGPPLGDRRRQRQAARRTTPRRRTRPNLGPTNPALVDEVKGATRRAARGRPGQRRTPSRSTS